jgi:EAL domain-containing protein (putative c-di-GMP-specific phosphodiesterase class I)
MAASIERGVYGPRAVVPADEFRRAMNHGEVVLHYQPQIELRAMAVSGAEALIRWQHPTGGLLPPDDFLPALAHSPLMPSVTDWVVLTAVRAAADWAQLSVAVNISAADAARRGLVDTVRRALDGSGLQPERLVLELTEHALVGDIDGATQNLGALADDGVRVSLDDFGTGYSSLLYLRALPIHEIKIDRTFTMGIGTNGDDDAIVAGLVQLGHAIGVRVVAEGVETQEQLTVLASLDCDAAQGFLFGRATERLVLPNLPASSPPAARPPQRRRRRGEAIATEEAAATIRLLVEAGASLHTIAARLNTEGVRTAQGTRWVGATVGRALTQL